MSSTTTKSLSKIINQNIKKEIDKNKKKTTYKKLLFRAGDNLPVYTFERLSH